jgi:hypothetical protein
MGDWMTWEGGALTADVVTDISAAHTAEVTQHPIEGGSVISDHVQMQPPTVAFEFSQSKTSLRDADLEWKQAPINVRESQFVPQGLLALTMAAGAAVGALTNAIGLTSSGTLKTWTLTAKTSKDRIHEMHDALIAAMGKFVSFSYQGLVLSDYVLTGVKYARSNQHGGLCKFQVEAVHVTTVQTASSSLSGIGAGAGGAGPLSTIPSVSKGAQTAETVEKEVVKKSLLASGLDALGGGLF